jgi:hypothetical protein
MKEGVHIAEIGNMIPILEQRAREFDATHGANGCAMATDYRERSQYRQGSREEITEEKAGYHTAG